MDRIDLTILRELQEDASQPLEEIARKANSSKTPVWNRIKKMREAGMKARETAEALLRALCEDEASAEGFAVAALKRANEDDEKEKW